MLDAFILCGGLGTRFREVSKLIPKALAPVGKDLFIDLIIRSLKRQNFQNIVLGTGYLSKKISRHVESKYNGSLSISKEDRPLGTGGAFKLALPKFQSENVLVLNGDTYIDCDFKSLVEFHNNKSAICTIISSPVESSEDYGGMRVDSNGLVLDFHEKNDKKTNKLVNAGVYVLNKNAVDRMEDIFSMERDLFPILSKNRSLFSLTQNNKFYDIGTLKKYEILKNQLL